MEILTPTLNNVAVLARMQGQVLGLYRRRPDVEQIISGNYVLEASSAKAGIRSGAA